jgi:hypothetical protein
MFCCRARAGPSLYRMQVCGGPVQARRYLCRYLCHILGPHSPPSIQYFELCRSRSRLAIVSICSPFSGLARACFKGTMFRVKTRLKNKDGR